ncbi:MAG: hypothetical protein GY756_11780 [bacterium]|nr:hypothetical protein [bacterium]
MKLKKLNLNLFLLIIILLLSCKKNNIENEPLVEVRTIEGDIYVSITGDDSNPGTEDLPLKTIQKAANSAVSGQVVVVEDGYYDEYVTIQESGTTEENKIVFFSRSLHGAACRGFKIQGNYISIDGFNVEANGDSNWTGISIDQCSNIDVLNCFIHECPIGGISASRVENIKITDNKLEHNGQSGVSIIGSYGLIEGNEISRTVQYHPKGNEPGFTGADADGLRIFGDNHIIRGNTIVNIGDPNDSGNVDPHSDCIQTWDGGTNGRPVMTNTIIEGNFFSVNHPSGKGIIIDATKGNACHHLMIRNNIFEFRDIGISAYNGEYHDIFVYNNVFKAKIDDASWGTSLSFKNIENYAVINNITVDCHPEHRHIVDGNGVVDYNLAWNSDGSLPTLVPAVQDNELRGEDPKFVNYTGIHQQNDYHLLSSSPAVNTAMTLDDVLFDFDNVSRPQGTAYDFGAFKYKAEK